MPENPASENESSYASSAVTPATPKARFRLSFGRLAVLFMMAATGWGLGYANSPREVILLEPGDDDLVVLNGCVVSACGYMATIRAQHRLDRSFWSRVMLVRYKGSNAGHAYCVWQTDGHVFGYDRNGGSFPIPGDSRDPMTIAESLSTELERVTKRPMRVERAEFIEPRHAKLYAY